MYPSSVVQTGVKSLGCENSTAHESPIHSWKRMRPSVVWASKSGAMSPSWSAMEYLEELVADSLNLRRDRRSARISDEQHVGGPVAEQLSGEISLLPAPSCRKDRPEGQHAVYVLDVRRGQSQRAHVE